MEDDNEEGGEEEEEEGDNCNKCKKEYFWEFILEARDILRNCWKNHHCRKELCYNFVPALLQLCSSFVTTLL